MDLDQSAPRREPLDELELVGIAASLILATIVVRYALAPAGVSDLASAAAFLAVLSFAALPFLARRARRQRHGATA